MWIQSFWSWLGQDGRTDRIFGVVFDRQKICAISLVLLLAYVMWWKGLSGRPVCLSIRWLQKGEWTCFRFSYVQIECANVVTRCRFDYWSQSVDFNRVLLLIHFFTFCCHSCDGDAAHRDVAFFVSFNALFYSLLAFFETKISGVPETHRHTKFLRLCVSPQTWTKKPVGVSDRQ